MIPHIWAINIHFRVNGKWCVGVGVWVRVCVCVWWGGEREREEKKRGEYMNEMKLRQNRKNHLYRSSGIRGRIHTFWISN